MRALLYLSLIACDPVVLPGDPVPDATIVDASPADALAPAACIRASGDVDFGELGVGQSAEAEIILTGCRTQDVAISSLSIDAFGPDPGFRFANNSPVEALLAPRRAADPVAQARVRVVFTPTHSGREYSATIRLQTTDPERPRVDIRVTGVADWREAPCKPWQALTEGAERTVSPGDVIRLNALPPARLAAEQATIVWQVVQRPAGSRTNVVERFADPDDPAIGGPGDDAATPIAQFYVDVAGTYTFEVQTTLPDAANCETQVAQVRVLACPCPGDLHIQLRWRIDPDNPPPVGLRSNLDLHLVHPDGTRWNDERLDCRSINPTPDWGIARFLPDDPSLDSDDADAPGVENIFLFRAEGPEAVTGSYRVGVEHVRPEWTARADVEIRVAGEVVWSASDRVLTANQGWWDVAAVGWQNGELTVAPLDRTFSARPPLDSLLNEGARCLTNDDPPCAPGTACVGASAGRSGVCAP